MSGGAPSPQIPTFPVLLVEDRDSLRAMLRHALEAHAHTVIEARDESEALVRLRQSRPAVVLTDLKLPQGDGFGVLRSAKEIDPDLPEVVMTAYGSIQDAVVAMRDGSMDFLDKPVDPDQLATPTDGFAPSHDLDRYFLGKMQSLYVKRPPEGSQPSEGPKGPNGYINN